MLHYQVHLPTNLHDNAPWLVLLHGRGADEEDLLALAEFFPDHLVVAPRAPFAAMQWNYGPGYAWYQHLGGTTPDPEHFEHSQNELHSFVIALPDLLDFKPGPLFLGGFSQGGTMSIGYALRNPGAMSTVLNLSGFLPEHPSVHVTAETVADTYFIGRTAFMIWLSRIRWRNRVAASSRPPTPAWPLSICRLTTPSRITPSPTSKHS